MKYYTTSLKGWRKKQSKPLSEQLVLYLNIFNNVLNAMFFLSEHKINHFDIKCDNFLLQPLSPYLTPSEIFSQKSNIPNFTVILADFGEAKKFTDDDDELTQRNRGTDFIKSPEMLELAFAKKNFQGDRRQKVGVDNKSDTWSLGCLFYELLTGQFMFYDQDFMR
jgi:serine/threonine protein kinase